MSDLLCRSRKPFAGSSLRPVFMLPLVSVFSLACSHASGNTQDAGQGNSPVTLAEAESGVSARPDLLDSPIPSTAKALLSLRLDDTLGSYGEADVLFGHLTKEERRAMDTDVQRLQDQIVGLEFEDLRGVTVFATNVSNFAAVFEGVSGRPRGEVAETIGGSPAVRVPNTPLLALVSTGRLYVGTGPGITDALEVAGGRAPSLAQEAGPLSDLLLEPERGYLLLVLRRDLVPAAMTGDLGPMVPDALALRFNGERLVAEISAPQAQLEKMLETYDLVVRGAMGKLQDERAKAEEPEKELMTVYGYYSALSMTRQLRPELVDGRLVLDHPLDLSGGSAMTTTAVVGILAAVAIPALSKYMRRAKTSEAKANIARVFDSVAAVGMGMRKPGKCPVGRGKSGSSGMTPPLSLDCSVGPGGRCVPDEAGGGGGAGYYSKELWTKNDVWSAIDFRQDEGHYYHYEYEWKQVDRKTCEFTIRAMGDLDGDGEFSTFERSGAITPEGVNAAMGLFVDKELE